MTKVFLKNIPNIVSILGVLPVFLLLLEDGYKYLIPLIIYNNIMDDLDGILASKLNLRSEFGANLDNVCDGVSHTIFVMSVGLHFGNGFSAIAIAGAVATIAILLRVVSRMTTPSLNGGGSATNELIRHMLLLLLVATIFGFNAVPYLIVLFFTHAVTMLAPFPMPYMIRSMAKSASAIALVNAALVIAWLVPMTTPIIAVGFAATYLYAFVAGGRKWLTNRQPGN